MSACMCAYLDTSCMLIVHPLSPILTFAFTTLSFVLVEVGDVSHDSYFPFQVGLVQGMVKRKEK